MDIHDTNSQAILNAKKGDNARKIYISLTDGGKPYSISVGCTAKLRAKKPDDSVLYNDCTIQDNVIEYTLTNQTSAYPGNVECEVELIGTDEKKITSPRFTIVVDDTIASDAEIESTNEFTALTNAIDACENLNLSVSKVLNTTVINVTKKDGTLESATVFDGEKGEKGDKGDPGDASYDTEWKTGTSNLSNVTVQYKKNGNLVTVRFSGLPSSSISTGTKIGSVPYACGDIDSDLGTHFAVGTWGSGIYDIQMRGTDIYFYQMLYGTNNLYLYLTTFQFTYSI